LGAATVNKVSVAILKSGIPIPPLTKRTAIVVEHTGRRSGRRYSTPMGYVKASGDRLHVVAEHGDRADWVRNAMKAPVKLWIGGQRFDATARMRPDLDPNRVWKEMSGRLIVAFAKLLAHDPRVVELQISKTITTR
jgi:deazaflavin-dependent oxidoreductase (nitroreductase family)